jgi:hypothetical protein
MEIDTICPMCNRLDEDGGHIFLHCKMVKQLWRNLELEEARVNLTDCGIGHAHYYLHDGAKTKVADNGNVVAMVDG